jgi:hypothetical protein
VFAVSAAVEVLDDVRMRPAAKYIGFCLDLCKTRFFIDRDFFDCNNPAVRKCGLINSAKLTPSLGSSSRRPYGLMIHVLCLQGENGAAIRDDLVRKVVRFNIEQKRTNVF